MVPLWFWKMQLSEFAACPLSEPNNRRDRERSGSKILKSALSEIVINYGLKPVAWDLVITEVSEMVVWLFLAAIKVALVQPVTLSSKWLSVTIDPNGSFTVFDKRAKVTWRSTQHIAPFRNLQRLADGKVSFQTEARQRDGKTFPVTVTMWLENDELVVEASVNDPKIQVGTFSFLPPLPPISPKSDLLIPFYGNGIAVPVDGKEFRGWFFRTYGALDMPFVGVTDGKVGYLLVGRKKCR